MPNLRHCGKRQFSAVGLRSAASQRVATVDVDLSLGGHRGPPGFRLTVWVYVRRPRGRMRLAVSSWRGTRWVEGRFLKILANVFLGCCCHLKRFPSTGF